MLDAVQDLLVEQGYGAVTSRKIGERAGVTHQTVFYYFGSLDDLLLALIARNAADFQERLDLALRDEHPLWALWNIARDRESGVIELQLKAMAVHNPAVRQAMSKNLETFRTKAIAALSSAIGDRWPQEAHMATALALMIESLGRYMVLDEAMTISAGHAPTIEFVERFMKEIELGKTETRDRLAK